MYNQVRKRSVFRQQSTKEIKAKQAAKREKAPKVPKVKKKPLKSKLGGNKARSKTQRAKKMQQKRNLIEKYNLPSVAHSRWGTGKRPTDTDILRGMLWTLFSKYIRDRDQGKPCISCGKHFELKQAGHFVPVGGSSVGLWFDEQNVHGECEKCNAFDSFHVVPMRKNLIALYGLKKVEELEQRRHQTTILDDEWYVEKIKYYSTHF